MNDSDEYRLALVGRGATLSKAARQGQANAARLLTVFAGMLSGAAVALAAWAAPALAAGDENRPTPSGFPVPRYVVLKFGEVNARAGPGDDHRLMWVYKARGLPVQVVAETREWRRVCDPRGGLAWVHARTIDGKRNVLGLDPPAAIHARPKAGSRVVAYLRPDALASLDRCKDGWCKIKVEHVSGWTPARSLWGTDETAQCR